ncbi:response regulator receiver protein [Desulfuromonas soudanensis]|uniref:Response regulator receiver protein n=1 Tax=Desulfuromonas soudanensis TaxID=1603606 RepID=A0A0M4D6W0_9BACT|nr:response regulator [Desulfuromonas soudanensis]ALC16760.1 response regulator receiver protein [Desulfuromonas soudanensis]
MRDLRTPLTILIADEDADGRLMIRQVFEEARLINSLRFVEGGEDLLDYLYCRGAYAAAGSAPRPGLILVDLNIPDTKVREALQAIKGHTHLKEIPVVVATNSRAEEDLLRTCDLGVHCFIAKPISFSALVDTVKSLHNYWFEIVAAPGVECGGIDD